MADKFYAGQKDYIQQLNAMNTTFEAATGASVTLTDDTTSNVTVYPVWGGGTGVVNPKISTTSLSFVPLTAELTVDGGVKFNAGSGITFSTAQKLLGNGTSTIEQYNGATAQALYVYNTRTDSSNYERGGISWSSNIMRLWSDQLGTGASRALSLGTTGANSIFLVTNGLTRWAVDSNGHIGVNGAGNNNLFDIGTASAAPRTIYASTSMVAPVQIANGAGSATTAQIQLSGTTQNWIGWNINGLGAPAFTTRSAGTKIVLYPSLSGTLLDYAIGIESGAMWFSTNNTSGGWKWYSGSTTPIASLAGNGVMTVNGLQFPATAVPSSDVNTLDDYEEGTFTPGLTFGGGNTGITYSAVTGGYTKIGRVVHYRIYITLSAKGTSTGAAAVTGLPFTVAAGGSTFHLQNLSFVGVTYTGNPFAITSPVSTTISLSYNNGATGAAGSITDTNFTNTSTIYLSGTYFV
jgi:hypothetical protein